MEPLSPTQIRELRRRVQDLEDRTRYLIASVFIPRSFVLYYEIAGDTFSMNDATGATLFKRERSARAVMKLLRSNCQLMKCRVTKRGKLVKSSVSAMPVAQSKRHDQSRDDRAGSPTALRAGARQLSRAGLDALADTALADHAAGRSRKL